MSNFKKTGLMDGSGSEPSGEWKTVNGASVFIQDGQSVEEAITQLPNNSNHKNNKSKTRDELWGKEHKDIKGKDAVNKLLSERDGHVKNAFNRSEIGGIDLIWGDDNSGLQHIIKRRDRFFSEGRGTISGLDMIEKIPEIMESGTVTFNEKTKRYNIEHNGFIIAIGATYDNEEVAWLITAMEKFK